MRFTTLLAMSLIASTATFAPLSASVAQEPPLPDAPKPLPSPRPEIGIRGGLVRLKSSDPFFSETFTVLSLPTGFPFLGPPTGIHVTLFPSPRFALEPQFSLTRISDEGDTFSIYMLGLQAMGFLAPDANRAPYVFATVLTVQTDESGGGSEGQNGFGGGIGYRRVYRNTIALRYEARVMRHSDADQKVTEIGFLVGFGAVIGSRPGEEKK